MKSVLLVYMGIEGTFLGCVLGCVILLGLISYFRK